MISLAGPSPEPVPAAARPPAVSVRSLQKRFAERTVLVDLSFEIHYGEVVAFLGANGSGKSTALRCIMGLTEAGAGQIALDGVELSGLNQTALREARQQTAMVFQKIHLVPRRTALQNVCAGALGRIRGPGSLHPAWFPRRIREQAMACLDRVGLAERALDPVARLSGGQQQRVAVARALCQGASTILADEPVSALDPHAAEQVMELLRELARSEQLAIAVVLHHPELARRYADRAIGLLNGRITIDAPVSELDQPLLDELYQPDREQVKER